MDKNQSKPLFIINPNAGRKKNKKFHRQLLKYQSKADIRFSKYPGHSSEIVKEEINNYDVFVTVGGDGTVNEIASALIGYNKKMAVFPAGSGNGFAREFSFTKDIHKLFNAIEKGKTIPTDVIFINDRPCIHVAGIGFDSTVVTQFQRLNKHGFINYSRTVLQVILGFNPIEASIETQNEIIRGKFFMINIANTGQFGYNVRICPQSKATDGKFELVLIFPFPKWKFPLFALKMMTGKLKPSRHVRFISVDNEVIINTPETNFEIEGEPVQLKSPVTIRIEKGALQVVNPK